jgi:hypothetical protein
LANESECPGRDAAQLAFVRIHDRLDDEWRIVPEEPAFREKVLEIVASPGGEVKNEWVDRRPIPRTEAWFEMAWARFRRGEIYDSG